MFRDVLMHLVLSDKTAAAEPLQPGDLYIGERNTGPHLLVCNCMSEDGS
jgi:hypothetical protein